MITAIIVAGGCVYAILSWLSMRHEAEWREDIERREARLRRARWK